MDKEVSTLKIAGVIAEYNPFHAGHAYHLQQTRVRTGCDYIVVCMAGSYTQRGTAARLSKWDRARMALTCGADAVFELPALFAVRTADVFARAGVTILNALGVDALSFGSETEDLPERMAEIRMSEPESVVGMVRENLSAGMSHARAWGVAAAEYLGVDETLLNAPNAILAAEYIRAMREIDSRMEPIAIQRRGGYHDPTFSGEGFASATAIRVALAEGRTGDALRAVPAEVRSILVEADAMHDPDDLLLHRLRTMTEAEIAALPDVAEGLERRVKRCAAQAATRQALIDMLKCKRYTWARLSRLTAHALLNLTQDLADRHPVPEYARLVAMREDARPLLKEMKSRTKLPILSDPAKLSENEIFQLECRATDLRALQCSCPAHRQANQEFTRKFVKL